MKVKDCKACGHAERGAIDKMLIEGRERYDFLSRRFELPITVLQEHRHRHIRGPMRSHGIDKIAMLTDMRITLDLLKARLAIAQQANDKDEIYLAVRAIRGYIESLVKLAGLNGTVGDELNEAQERTIGRILEALADFPDAREAVKKALEGAA